MNSLMSSFVTTSLILILGLVPLAASAETRYISDELRVPLRSSPCAGCSILHGGLPAGTRLEVIDTNDEGWSHITTSGGLQGWLRSQYLVAEPIARDRLQSAEQTLERVRSENAELRERVQQLEEHSAELEERLGTTVATRDQLESDLTSVTEASANALSLQEQNEELVKRNRMLQSEIDVLTATRDRLKADDTRKWFIYGALAVFLGALLSVLIPRLRPRKQFSEWA